MKLLIFIILFATKILGQELSSELNIHGSTKSIFSNFNLNIKVKKRLNIFVGASYGILNYDKDNLDYTDIPYRKLDDEAFYNIEEAYKSYSVSSFTSLKKGKGMNFGFGTFWHLNSKSFLLLNSNFSYYWVDDYVEALYSRHGLYYPIESITPSSFLFKKTIHYKVLSGSLNFGYMYSVSTKTKIKFLFHLPFYYPLTTLEYYPLGANFGLVGLEPNLSLGINYIIKKR